MLLSKKEQHARSIALLEELGKNREFDATAAYLLSREYSAVDRYNDALTTAQELVKRGYDTPNAYAAQADALAGLKRYREAKSALETALKKDPDHLASRQLMRNISAILGEGDHSLVKEPIEPVSIPEEVLAGIPTTRPMDVEDSGMYYIARVTATIFDPGKELRTTEFRKIRVINRNGVEAMNSMDMSFDPLLESMYVNRVEVTDAAGRVFKGKPEDCYVLDAPGDEVATQKKILHVPIPGLTADCTIEISWTHKDVSPPDQMRFTKHYFASGVPIRRTAYVLKADMSKITEKISSGIVKKQLAGAVCWQLDDPKEYVSEPNQPDPGYFLPMLVLCDPKQTWQGEGDEYLEKIKEMLQPAPACDSLARQLTAGVSDTPGRLLALAQHVQEQYAYKAIEFGTRGRIPQRAEQIIQNKYGDCKDHALLLYQLLRASGFEARLALVDATDELQPELPSLDQFDHIVTCVKESDGSFHFFDCTDKECRATDSPPAGLAGKQVLVLEAGASRLVRIPELTPDSSAFNASRQLTIGTTGDLMVRENIRISGPAAAYLRSRFKSVSADNRSKAIQQMINYAGVETQVRSASIDQLLSPQNPLTIDLEYVMLARFNRVQSQFVGNVPACWERFWLLPQYGGKRTSPFQIRMPMKYQNETTLLLPQGTTLATPPIKQESTDRFGLMQTDFTLAPGKLAWTTSIRTATGHFDVAAYEEYQQARQKMFRQLEPSLVLQSN